MTDKTINIRGELVSLQTPLVMGILNITDNSFYSDSRKQTDKDIRSRIVRIIKEGADIIDVGGYSTHPGAAEISIEEESKRLSIALRILNREYPQIPVSVDTFRASVARMAVEEYGADIINDVSGGGLDSEMFATVAALRKPYIMMHMRGTPQTMQEHTNYECLIADIRKYFADKIYELELLGVNDIIIDPGLGFSKTIDQNYKLIAGINEFAIFNRPILVGISRKAMIYRLLKTTPSESLNGTTALNALALAGGADILRVHDVKEAVEVVQVVSKYKEYI